MASPFASISLVTLADLVFQVPTEDLVSDPETEATISGTAEVAIKAYLRQAKGQRRQTDNAAPINTHPFVVDAQSIKLEGYFADPMTPPEGVVGGSVAKLTMTLASQTVTGDFVLDPFFPAPYNLIHQKLGTKMSGFLLDPVIKSIWAPGI